MRWPSAPAMVRAARHVADGRARGATPRVFGLLLADAGARLAERSVAGVRLVSYRPHRMSTKLDPRPLSHHSKVESPRRVLGRRPRVLIVAAAVALLALMIFGYVLSKNYKVLAEGALLPYTDSKVARLRLFDAVTLYVAKERTRPLDVLNVSSWSASPGSPWRSRVSAMSAGSEWSTSDFAERLTAMRRGMPSRRQSAQRASAVSRTCAVKRLIMPVSSATAMKAPGSTGPSAG